MAFSINIGKNEIKGHGRGKQKISYCNTKVASTFMASL
jgi:hypothetical protein